MASNFEFRVLACYLVVMFLFPVIRWHKTRLSPAVAGIRGERQNRARLVAAGLFLVPLGLFLFDGPWPWDPDLDVPTWARWIAAVPATLAVLLMVWACRYAAFGHPHREEKFVTDGPYRWLRHPQMLAASLFFLTMAILTSNGLVLISSILAVLLLRLVAAPAVEADLQAKYSTAYDDYCQRTGCFLIWPGKVHKAQYIVPRRFGLSAVLALTTFFAILFGGLHFINSPPVVYLFVSTEITAICLVQIVFGSAPRSASALTGAVLLPFWTLISLSADLNRISTFQTLIFCMFVAIFGALLGYCIGALAAGFFLAMDLFESYSDGSKQNFPHTMPPDADQQIP